MSHRSYQVRNSESPELRVLSGSLSLELHGLGQQTGELSCQVSVRVNTLRLSRLSKHLQKHQLVLVAVKVSGMLHLQVPYGLEGREHGRVGLLLLLLSGE